MFYFFGGFMKTKKSHYYISPTKYHIGQSRRDLISHFNRVKSPRILPFSGTTKILRKLFFHYARINYHIWSNTTTINNCEMKNHHEQMYIGTIARKIGLKLVLEISLDILKKKKLTSKRRLNTQLGRSYGSEFFPYTPNTYL